MMAHQFSLAESAAHPNLDQTAASSAMGSYAEPQSKKLNIAVAGLGRMVSPDQSLRDFENSALLRSHLVFLLFAWV